MSVPRVGVLALQGDTREHLAALREAGADALPVRRRSELEAVDGLIIPGGESTAMSHLLLEFDLLDAVSGENSDSYAVQLVCHVGCLRVLDGEMTPSYPWRPGQTRSLDRRRAPARPSSPSKTAAVRRPLLT